MTSANNGAGSTEAPEQETKFVRLMNSSQKKLANMKHIDAKTAMENMIFPILAALYEEMDTELDGVFDRLDNMEVDDDVVEALADSPEFIRDFSTYVLWVGNTCDTLLRLGGFIATNEADKTQAVFTAKATDDIKMLYQQIAETNAAIIGKVKQLEEQIDELVEDDDGDTGEGDVAVGGGVVIGVDGEGDGDDAVDVSVADTNPNLSIGGSVVNASVVTTSTPTPEVEDEEVELKA